MPGKNVCFGLIFATLSSVTMFATEPVTVEAQVALQVGDKTEESVVVIDSENYTQLSMKDENLGFALRLSDTKEGDERFQTTPTDNGKPIANFFYSGKGTTFGAGCRLNGYRFEKELAVTFLSIKRLS